MLWLVVLWLVALRGLPVGATARAVGALSGLPPYAGVAVAVAVTLLLAALPVLAGAWLARAVMLLSAGGRGGPPAPARAAARAGSPAGRLRRSPDVNTGRAQPLAGDRLRREVPAAAGFSSLYGKVYSTPGNEQVDATRRS